MKAFHQCFDTVVGICSL